MGIFTAFFDYLSNSSLSVQIGVLFVVGAMTLYFTSDSRPANAPPLVSYRVPFLGNAVEYGIHPINFLKECMEKVIFLL
jgi:sterol 14-demethylase